MKFFKIFRAMKLEKNIFAIFLRLSPKAREYFVDYTDSYSKLS